MQGNYQVIARRWRPRRFGELVGQEPIVRTLENAIRLHKIAHAFLFIGPRGTGKTSMARLLAMALNAPDHPSSEADPDREPCRSIFEGHCMDVIEIDGASNNSVEQIRSLREECQYAPTSCRFKIYIIDEVHMLSQSAFNALLKTLEEPPEHVKFIFATTEAYKIPQTIISRCQRFEFKPISEAIIIQKLQQIAQRENIQAEPLALQAIARIADGGMRDAQSILDQITSFGNNVIEERDVIDAYGLVSAEKLSTIMHCVENADYGGIIRLAEQLNHCNFTGILLDIEKQLRSKLFTLKNSVEIAKTLKFLDIIVSAKDATRNSNAPEVMFQLTLFRAIEALERRSIDQIITLLRRMQNISGDCGEDHPPRMPAEGEGSRINDSEFGGTPPSPLSRESEGEGGGSPTEENCDGEKLEDGANFNQLPKGTREKLKNLFHIEE
ncbi:MAG: DNA polymerase III subunit gamma/tau [Puniceicoccales bacterium]|jgi:DNA polymerase-3 subunit gamma/tau|nr:DNA polymerase III subunit gamma/tau [Puniceicoccales bacterium]